jgi:hypothetical protein
MGASNHIHPEVLPVSAAPLPIHRSGSPTQPLHWDWVSDWITINSALAALEARVRRGISGESRPDSVQ